jgi:hypothetical protein
MISNKQAALLLSVLFAPMVLVAGGTGQLTSYWEELKATARDYAQQAAAWRATKAEEVRMRTKIAGLEKGLEVARDNFTQAEQNGNPGAVDKAIREYEKVKSDLLTQQAELAGFNYFGVRISGSASADEELEAEKELLKRGLAKFNYQEYLAVGKMAEAIAKAKSSGRPEDIKAANDAVDEFYSKEEKRMRYAKSLKQVEAKEVEAQSRKQKSDIGYQQSVLPQGGSWWRNRTYDAGGQSIRERLLRNKAREEGLRRARHQLEEPTSY